MKERVFWISLSYATYGIISRDGVIVRVPPIAHWMKGRTLQQIKPWLLEKKAIVKEI